MSLLTIEDLYVDIEGRAGTTAVLQGVNLELEPGEILGIVGETGSGKTMTALSVLRLFPPGARVRRGRVLFEGLDVLEAPLEEVRRLRGGRIGMIFQQPRASLNPLRPVVHQIGDRLVDHLGLSRREATKRALGLLEQVGIPDPAIRGFQYPHQLSGGMCQRVMVAMAIACEPRLLLADEPTTGLDMTLQLQIVDLIRDLARASGMAVIFITHDLGVAARLCDRIGVMYAGEIVEYGPTGEVLDRPLHPYAAGLIRAMESLECGERPEAIPGTVPRFREPPAHCPFADRCPVVFERCRQQRPALLPVEASRRVACHLHSGGAG